MSDFASDSFYHMFKERKNIILNYSWNRTRRDFVEMTNLATVTFNMSIMGFILLGYVTY